MKKQNFALLINVDNLSPAYLKVILAEGMKYGNIPIRRIYGDWVGSNRRPWKELLAKYSVDPVQEYNADSAIILEAMELANTDSVDGLILASYDSDYAKLAKKLRDTGKVVIGMGAEETPDAYINTCEKFVVLDVFPKSVLIGTEDVHGKIDCNIREEAGGSVPDDGSRKGDLSPKVKEEYKAEAIQAAEESIGATAGPNDASSDMLRVDGEEELSEKNASEKNNAEEESVVVSMEDVEQFILSVLSRDGYNGKVLLEALALMLREQFPGFSHKLFGYKKFTGFIEAMPQLKLLTIERMFVNSMPDVYVIRKDGKACEDINVSIPEGDPYRLEDVTPLAELEQFVMDIIDQEGNAGKIALGKVKYLIRKEYPTFDERNYGTAKFTKFVQLMQGVSIVNEVEDGKSPVTYVLKN